MSNTQGAYGQGAYENGGCGPWSRGRGFGRWSPVELVAMVLGFMVFWPIGLAVLGYKYWQGKTGGPDLQTAAVGAFGRARSAYDGFQASRGASRAAWTAPTWATGFTASTGNAAFDEWKRTELSRLEEERSRLEQSHREFAEWMETVRKAKDREEFDRFMNERRGRGA